MKRSAAPFDLQARAAWPLPEPALAYFPDARSASDRDLVAGAPLLDRGVSVPHPDDSSHSVNPSESRPAPKSGEHGHVPVLLDRCVELLTPALTRHHADGSGAVLVDAAEVVDAVAELVPVGLIAAQRNFQANAKALDTATQVSQAILNIRS